MKIKNCMPGALLLLVLFSHSFAYVKMRIIFYHIKSSQGISEFERDNLKQAVKNAIIRNPKFELVPDEYIEAVFKRNNISVDGCTETACAVKVGRDDQIAAKYSMTGELGRTSEGLYRINLNVVDVAQESMFWAPYPIRLAKDADAFAGIAASLIGELSDLFDVNGRITKVESDSSLLIDIGADLGVKIGEKYYIVNEEQLGTSEMDVQRDTLGSAYIFAVAKAISKAKIIRHSRPIDIGAKLYPMISEQDRIAPNIKHYPIANASTDLDLVIDAEISDNSGIQSAQVFYGGALSNFNKIKMAVIPEQKNGYRAIIPKAQLASHKILHYYFQAEDESGNRRVLRDQNDNPFSVTIAVRDTIPPVITYKPPQEMETAKQVHFSVNVRDNVRVDKVRLAYVFSSAGAFTGQTGAGSNRQAPVFQIQNMEVYATDIYGADLELQPSTPPFLYYYIEASDQSGNKKNIGSAAQPLRLEIKSVDKIPPRIEIVYTNYSRSNKKFTIRARIIDDSPLGACAVQYGAKEDSMQDRQVLTHYWKDQFQTIIELNDATLKNLYYIVAASDRYGNAVQSPIGIEQIVADREVLKIDVTPPDLSLHFPNQWGWKSANYETSRKLIYYFTIRAVDNVKIKEVAVYVRSTVDSQYVKLAMTELHPQEFWQTVCVGDDLGLEYYIVATDVNNLQSNYKNAATPVIVKIGKDPRKIVDLPKGLRTMMNKNGE